MSTQRKSYKHAWFGLIFDFVAMIDYLVIPIWVVACLYFFVFLLANHWLPTIETGILLSILSWCIYHYG